MMYVRKFYWSAIAIVFLIGIQVSFTMHHSIAAPIEVTARKTADFVDSIGVEVRFYPDEPSALWTDTLKPRLEELGVKHIRTNISATAKSLSPDSRGAITARRIKELGDLNPPIKTTGILREFDTWISKARAIKYLGNSLEAIEGPNEPNRKGEGFDYVDRQGIRHGNYDLNNDGEKEEHGRGWLHGARLFMEDLNFYVKQYSQLDIISFSPTRGAYKKVAKYQQENNWRLEDWVDYGNFHLYRKAKPEAGIPLEEVKATMYPTKPIVITETGYSTDDDDWASVPNEDIQAIYNLRSALELFRLGVKRTYIFSLLRLEHARSFSLLDPNDLETPKYEPRTSFNTIRDTISLLEGSDSDFTPGKLNYEIINESSNKLSKRNSIRSLALQKSDNKYYLILWLAVNYNYRDRDRQLELKVNSPNFISANLYRPVTRGKEIVANINNPSAFNTIEVTDRPLIVELLPQK